MMNMEFCYNLFPARLYFKPQGLMIKKKAPNGCRMKEPSLKSKVKFAKIRTLPLS